MSSPNNDKLDKLVATARAAYASRENGYRQRALKLYPWVCGRCMREFVQANLQELTVHHRDHDHDNNPNDGSNWSYCACIAMTMSINVPLMLIVMAIHAQ